MRLMTFLIEVSRTVTHPPESLDLPALVVHGAADPLVPFERHARLFERRRPRAELLAIDGGEHAAVFTYRDAVRAKVSAFMERHFSAGPGARH